MGFVEGRPCEVIKTKTVGVYSIKELEVMTGIKAHTIRIWEQRYGILHPNRTDTNIRFYTEQDMKHLLNIALLNKNGFKISKISHMSPEQLKNKVLELSESNFEHFNQIDSLVMAMLTFDEDSFEKIISTNILRSGFESTFQHIVFPFLLRIGILWQTGIIRPSQEHFMSNLIRQKIIIATDGQFIPKNPEAARFMLFLPEREMHELPLLYLNYVIRSRRQHSLYLGASVPIEDVVACYHDYKPDFMFTSCISSPIEADVQAYINELALKCPDSTLVISGKQVLDARPALPPNVVLLSSIQESADFIESQVLHARS